MKSLCVVLLLVGVGSLHPNTAWAQPEASAPRSPSLAVGLQVLPITGVSARLNIERLTFQVAGLPATLFGIREKNFIGARLGYKVAERSTYNLFVSTSVDLFISRRPVAVQVEPWFRVERAVRADQLFSLTGGAESFLGPHWSLSGEAGIGYRRDGVQQGELAGNDDGFLPMLGIGLHYYF